MYEYNGSAGLQYGLLAIGALGLALSACGGPDQAAQEQQGLGFRSITSVGPCDLAYTVVNVYPSTYWVDADEDGIVDQGEIADLDVQPVNGPIGAPGSGQIDPSQVGEVDDLDLGGLDTALDGVWWITDYFTLLDVGSYDVEVTIYDTDNNVIDTEIHNDVQVFSGQTTEDTFIFECDGETIQGLDIVVLVNEGPSIIDFSYNDGKFHKVCGENCMTAGFEAGTDGETMTVTWEAYPHDTSGAPLTYPGPGGDLDNFTEQIITAGDSEYCFVCEAPGTFDIWVTVKNAAGQITQFQALAHCDDPAVGYCVQDTNMNPVAAPADRAIYCSGTQPCVESAGCGTANGTGSSGGSQTYDTCSGSNQPCCFYSIAGPSGSGFGFLEYGHAEKNIFPGIPNGAFDDAEGKITLDRHLTYFDMAWQLNKTGRYEITESKLQAVNFHHVDSFFDISYSIAGITTGSAKLDEAIRAETGAQFPKLEDVKVIGLASIEELDGSGGRNKTELIVAVGVSKLAFSENAIGERTNSEEIAFYLIDGAEWKLRAVFGVAKEGIMAWEDGLGGYNFAIQGDYAGMITGYSFISQKAGSEGDEIVEAFATKPDRDAIRQQTDVMSLGDVLGPEIGVFAVPLCEASALEALDETCVKESEHFGNLPTCYELAEEANCL